MASFLKLVDLLSETIRVSDCRKKFSDPALKILFVDRQTRQRLDFLCYIALFNDNCKHFGKCCFTAIIIVKFKLEAEAIMTWPVDCVMAKNISSRAKTFSISCDGKSSFYRNQPAFVVCNNFIFNERKLI